MISVFDGRYKDRTNFTSNEFLHINSSGLSYITYSGRPRSVQIYRPDGRVDYHFLLVTEGSLLAVCGGKEYVLQVGDALFYKPNDPQSYTFSVDENSLNEAHLHIHFCGTAAEEMLKKAGFDRSLVVRNTPSDAKCIFELLIRNYRSGDELTACGNLLRLVSLLSPDGTRPFKDTEMLVFKEAEYISAHYSEEIDFDLCAKRCNMSRSRFTHLFTKTVGTSPLQYQQQFRLEQASELLRFSGLSISEVSESVGFSDALYFSRLFRKHTGISPSEYRKK